METIIASLITGIFGVIVVLITNVYINKRGYDKIDNKIGNTGDKTSNVYSKVDNIHLITTKNEALYQNLNQDQKEVRNSVNKLVFDWEKSVLEVKELIIRNKELLKELETIKEYKIKLEHENKNINLKVNKLELDNKKILEENKGLRNTNKILKEGLERYIEKDKSINMDDWDLER